MQCKLGEKVWRCRYHEDIAAAPPNEPVEPSQGEAQTSCSKRPDEMAISIRPAEVLRVKCDRNLMSESESVVPRFHLVFILIISILMLIL